ncbi:unnamed protein product, partial [Clonostachys chloroleuca]
MTGASGYIGHYIVSQLLQSGWTLRGTENIPNLGTSLKASDVLSHFLNYVFSNDTMLLNFHTDEPERSQCYFSLKKEPGEPLEPRPIEI